MRKKIFLALCGLLSIYTSAQENNPIVLEINNKPITKSEFLKVNFVCKFFRADLT